MKKAEGHQLCKSGSVLWCRRCGSFDGNKAVGLYKECQPPSKIVTTGGRWAQLQRLRSGRHSVDGTCLPAATDVQGVPIVTNFGHARKKGLDDTPTDPSFKPYVHEDLTIAKSTQSSASGRSASEKARLRH